MKPNLRMQDVPALAGVARDRRAGRDGQYLGSPAGFRPFEHGVDVSIQSPVPCISRSFRSRNRNDHRGGQSVFEQMADA